MKRWLACLLWALVLLIGWYRWQQASSGVIHGVDFAAVWQAAQNLIAGEALYNPQGFGFVYFPSAALLFLPFASLSSEVAADVWAGVSLGSLVAACVVLVRAWHGPTWLAPASAAVVVASSPALGVMVGNVDLLMPLLLALSVADLARDRWSRVGVWTGLSIAVKPLVLAPVVLLAIQSRWRATCLAIALPLLLSLPVLGLTEQVETFVTRTVPFLLSGESDDVQAVSLALVSVLRDAPEGVQLGVRLLVLGLAAITAVLVYRRPAALPIRWLETVVVLQVGLMLSSEFAFTHHAAVVLLLIPATAAPDALARRWPVLLALLVVASPKTLPLGDLDEVLAVQGCVGLVAVLVAMCIAVLTSHRSARLRTLPALDAGRHVRS